MILKLEDLKTIDTPYPEDIIWVIYDKVENIKYCKVAFKPITHIGFDFVLIDEETMEVVKGEKDHPINDIKAIYFTTNKHSYSIVTNRMAYLLNDEGKTIERIN